MKIFFKYVDKLDIENHKQLNITKLLLNVNVQLTNIKACLGRFQQHNWVSISQVF